MAELVSIVEVRYVDHHLPMFIGNALSLALRLRNKNNGASQTHIPKKVAISAKPGASIVLGPR